MRAGIWTGILAGLLLLAGCTDFEQRRIPTAPAASPMTVEPRDDESADEAAVDEPLPMPTRKPDTLASRPDLDPERLIGLSTMQAESLLGRPALEDERPPAKIWTYNAKACVLSIFFYPDINTRVFQALTYEFNEEAKTDAAKRRCLEELVREPTG